MRPETAYPGGVLFDMDGLLFDSERPAIPLIMALSREMGTPVSEEVIRRTIGCNAVLSRRIYEESVPDVDYAGLFGRFDAVMQERGARGQIALKDGAAELLDWLRQRNVPCAVASSSPLRTVEAYLEGAGIRGYFSCLVTGDILKHSKPHPEAFQKAAAGLGQRPEDCLVLEDSPNGIRAGRTALCRVCMVPDLFPWREEMRAFADWHLSSLREVPALIEREWGRA